MILLPVSGSWGKKPHGGLGRSILAGTITVSAMRKALELVPAIYRPAAWARGEDLPLEQSRPACRSCIFRTFLFEKELFDHVS